MTHIHVSVYYHSDSKIIEKNNVCIRAHRPPQRRPIAPTFHYTWGPYDKKMRQRRPAKRWYNIEDLHGRILEQYALAENNTSHAGFGSGMMRPSPNHGTLRLHDDKALEVAWWGLRPTTGHYGCTTIRLWKWHDEAFAQPWDTTAARR